jgi:hypothetical protein
MAVPSSSAGSRTFRIGDLLNGAAPSLSAANAELPTDRGGLNYRCCRALSDTGLLPMSTSTVHLACAPC